MVERAQIRKPEKAGIPRGFSLIELMVAMSVLAIGILGGIMVIAVATANNGRSKLHTTTETMAQNVMEKITAIPVKATATQTQIVDCAGNVFTIETAGPGSGLITSGAFAGSVDFSQAPQPNYSMNYVMCSTPGTAVAYDVRWAIGKGPTPSTQVVTVSAKPLLNNAAPAARLTLPFTLHQLRGDF